MGQIKIFGHASFLSGHRDAISDAIHSALVSAFAYPLEKRFQRFFPLTDEEFIHPAERTGAYLIIEVVLFPGRSTEAKKSFYRQVLANLKRSVGIEPIDVEIVLFESSKKNWSIRGIPGDELKLNYQVEV